MYNGYDSVSLNPDLSIAVTDMSLQKLKGISEFARNEWGSQKTKITNVVAKIIFKIFEIIF